MQAGHFYYYANAKSTMTIKTPLLIATFTIVLTGCAATGKSYSERVSTKPAVSPSDARLIVFRTKENFQYSARSTAVKIDGKASGNCDYGGFNTFDVAPGSHVVTVDIWDTPGKCELPIEVTGGNTHFFEIQPRLGNLLASVGAGIIGAAIESAGQRCGGAFAITPIEENAALPKLRELRATE